MKYATMTNEAISKRIRELSDILDYGYGDKWDEAYSEYCELSAIQQERYREENQAEFDAFYEKYIEGKKWEEIHPEDWQFYSDWHKDMYGYRPKCI